MENGATLGLRIQQARKAAGLSQEALGEQLGVSRQAVSKWEADAAVPELDKLIAMSRVFGMPVGQLLGVETQKEADEPEQAEPRASGELTERELAAVEAIAAKYAEELQKRQTPFWTKGRKLAVAAAALVLVLAGISLGDQMQRIDRRFNSLQQQMNNIDSSVSRQINGLTGQIGNILEESSRILSYSQAEVIDFDPAGQTVDLRLAASLKEWTETTEAEFTATLSDGRQYSAVATGKNGMFTAELLKVPMNDEIKVSVTLKDGTGGRTADVETLYDCSPGNFGLWVDACMGASWTNRTETVQLSGMELYIAAGFPGKLLYPTAVELRVYRSGSKEPETVIPIEEAVELFRTAGMVWMEQVTDYDMEVTVPVGDRVTVVIQVEDNVGQFTYATLLQVENVGGVIEWEESAPADAHAVPWA